MLMIKDLNLDSECSVLVAITFAKEVLHIYESKNPNNDGPRDAIRAAEECIFTSFTSKDPAELLRKAQSDAGLYSKGTLDADYFPGYAAASAYSAAGAAFYHLKNNYKYAMAHASFSANSASTSTGLKGRSEENARYVHEGLKRLLPMILRYKIESGQAFKSPDEVFEYLSDEDKELFLFNLDILR